MRWTSAALVLFLAQQNGPGPLTPVQRQETIRSVESALSGDYLYEDVGRRLAQVLEARFEQGEFDRFTDPASFASALEELLRHETNDQHFLVWHGPLADLLKRVPGLSGPAFGRTEILPGGIGYIEVRNFLSIDGADADRAMAAVKDASALVFDLRETPGGNRQPTLYLSSYLFETRTHLVNILARGAASPDEVWTTDVQGSRRPTVPVYVLVSTHTASAGEMFAFGLQRAGRAVLVGEKTIGAGHSIRFTALPNGFQMLVPISRTVDPRTGEGWERVGVQPDVAVPAAQALDAAVRLIHAK
jgi:hypothetical protein